MKASFFTLLFATACVLLFTKCKKDDTTTTPATTGNYSPATTGSNWTYQYSEDTISGTVIVTATAKDTMINSKNYKLYINNLGDTTFSGKSGNNYYRFQSLPLNGVNHFLEELYLKDNMDVNATWTDTALVVYDTTGATIPVYLSHVITEKGVTKTVLGKSYNDVIHVNLSLSTILGTALGGGNFYYAKNVGLLSDTLTVALPALLGGETLHATDALVSYEIK